MQSWWNLLVISRLNKGPWIFLQCNTSGLLSSCKLLVILPRERLFYQTQCNAMQCNFTSYNAMQCNFTRCNASNLNISSEFPAVAAAAWVLVEDHLKRLVSPTWKHMILVSGKKWWYHLVLRYFDEDVMDVIVPGSLSHYLDRVPLQTSVK